MKKFGIYRRFKNVILLSFAFIIVMGCGSDRNTEQKALRQYLVGTWKIEKYVFIDKFYDKVVDERPPICNTSEYRLADNGRFIFRFRNTYSAPCNSPLGAQYGSYVFDEENYTIKFYEDNGTYKINSLTNNELQIINFGEGYTDYQSNQKNEVIAILRKQ